MGAFLVQTLVAALTCLIATDSVWESKPASQRTEGDAWQVLTKSPWAKATTAAITRRLTEEQLREGGKMGLSRGIGNEGVELKAAGQRSHRIFSPAPVAATVAFGFLPSPYIATTLGERSSGSACGIEIARNRTSHVAGRRL